jgi:hypothetical protein
MERPGRRSWKDRRAVRRIGCSDHGMGNRRGSADGRLRCYAHFTAREKRGSPRWALYHVGCDGCPDASVWRRLRHMQLRQEEAAADASRLQSGRAGAARARNVTARHWSWSAGGPPGAAFFPGVCAKSKGADPAAGSKKLRRISGPASKRRVDAVCKHTCRYLLKYSTYVDTCVCM